MLAILILIGLLFSGDEELLKDAFVTPDISLKSATVKYVTEEGQEVNVPAYEGQVEILTSAETALGKVREFIAGHGGKIIAQAPAVGIYIAEVSAGKEAELIEVLLKEDWVVDAHPYIPLEKNQAEYILDFWNEPSRERSHGAAVCYYDNAQKECTKETLDICFENKNCQEAEWPIFYQILREIKASENAPFITINLSLGPIARDKNGKQLPAAAVQAVRKAFFATLIQILGRDDVESVKKTIIINSAGNEGTDLTPIFQSLSSRKGFSRLVVVGAVTPAGKISSYTNYSKTERDIVYSVGGEKAIPMAGKNITWTGTSFAAPQITCLLNNWLRKSPERALNPQELRDSVFDTDIRKDVKRDFQYRYWIDPCLTQEPAGDSKEEPPPLPNTTAPKARPAKALSFSVPERLPSAKIGQNYNYSFCDPKAGDYLCGEAAIAINPNGGLPPYFFEQKTYYGLSLSVDGVLSGKPKIIGEHSLAICVSESVGEYSLDGPSTAKICKNTTLVIEDADAITYTNKSWEKLGNCVIKELGLERFTQILNDPSEQTQEEADIYLACFGDLTFEEFYNNIFTASQRECVVKEIGNARTQAFIADSNLAPTYEENLKVFQCGELITVSSVTEPPTPQTPTEEYVPAPVAKSENWKAALTGISGDIEAYDCAEMSMDYTVQLVFPDDLVAFLKNLKDLKEFNSKSITSGSFSGTENILRTNPDPLCGPARNGVNINGVLISGWSDFDSQLQRGILIINAKDYSTDLIPERSGVTALKVIRLIPISITEAKISGSWEDSGRKGNFTMIKQ